MGCVAGYVTVHCPSGPEGIRTPDLVSAIDARSQLRHRPGYWAKAILLEGHGDVKPSQPKAALCKF